MVETNTSVRAILTGRVKVNRREVTSAEWLALVDSAIEGIHLGFLTEFRPLVEHVQSGFRDKGAIAAYVLRVFDPPILEAALASLAWATSKTGFLKLAEIVPFPRIDELPRGGETGDSTVLHDVLSVEERLLLLSRKGNLFELQMLWQPVASVVVTPHGSIPAEFTLSSAQLKELTADEFLAILEEEIAEQAGRSAEDGGMLLGEQVVDSLLDVCARSASQLNQRADQLDASHSELGMRMSVFSSFW